MKSIQKLSRIALSCATLTAAILCPSLSQATPYASCFTNNAGTIGFYLNESGGNVTITYEDGSTNANFNGVTTGLAVAKGAQSFSLSGHSSYTIAVAKTGTGKASIISTQAAATPRGIDVNKRPGSPYFGFVYAVNASATSSNLAIRLLNSDFSGVLTNGGGVAWPNSASAPYRIAVNEDDYLTVGDFSSAHSGVWRVDPTLTSNQLLLGPIGQTAGYAAQSQGDQFSRPLLIGNLQSGGSAVLLTVDAGSIPNVNASQLNSILVYSNITLANMPRITTPDLLGPEVCLNLSLQNNYPGISYNPITGYIYASNRRDGPSGGSACLYIFAYSNLVVNTSAGGGSVNLGTAGVWNSLYNGGVNDYFATATPGSTVTTGLADSAVSADGKYIAGVGYGDNHIIVCALTNGIPDVSTLYTISNTVSLTSAGRGICWDAADNVYVSSSGGATFQEWTLGFTATSITTGNAAGPTGFALTLPSTVVSVYATNSIGSATVSQANTYGNPTNATFVIQRVGNTSAPLTVPFTLAGTAANGTYTIEASNSVILAAGQSSTNITVTAVTDGIARTTTTISLTVTTSGNYTLAPATATLALINAAPDQLVASVGIRTMYNSFSNDFAAIAFTRLGDTNAPTFTASSFTLSGTAVSGVDYTAPTSITFNPGDSVQTNYVYPLQNGQLPVASSTTPYVGNKTIVVSAGSGSGYTASTNTAVLTIIDSATPAATALFADPLTDPNDAANWAVTSANNNMQTNNIDNTVNFGYDLQNGNPGFYGAIPLPPNGATTALRLSVNKNNNPGAAAGINLYPTNVSFSGNYAVRFDLNIIQGLSGSSTTEGPLMGINHNGARTNWFTASGVVSGWGTPASTTWTSDGVWYWINADNDYSGGAYIEFTGVGGTNNNTGWQQPATATPVPFASNFKTNVFSGGAAWSPGLISNGSPLNDLPANNWANIEIRQFNNVVTLSADKVAIFTYTNKTVFTNGTLMLGYNDPFSSVGAQDSAAYFSNLRVVALGAPAISQIALNKVNSTVAINFTATDGNLSAASFSVSSSSTVNGTYANVPTATVTSLGGGAFQAVVPQNGAIRFYRILETN